MNVAELIEKTGYTLMNPAVPLTREVTGGCCCDLLSWVMASGQEGQAWVTVQTHMNVIAVASLHEMACVILPEGNTMEEAVLERATEEEIAVLGCSETGYAICCRLHDLGI